MTGIVRQPCAGYQRCGVLGDTTGTLIATINIGRHISRKLFDTSLSTQDSERLQVDDDDERISSAAKTAATKSGFHPKVYQHILDEFEKIKIEYESKMASSMKKAKNIPNFFSNASETLKILSSNRRLDSQ
ncbi:unnamed protein product [Rotaria sp. Silwood2]|nr:unnamed protein product [Rotaria sp. Silwood2]CAF4573210.1 unnamed protein product [Rotaria sp. Silwood2]CAF4600816.1 unnamed protein product [Rotaria sp. Silwood2]